jgi:hypothetical protein
VGSTLVFGSVRGLLGPDDVGQCGHQHRDAIKPGRRSVAPQVGVAARARRLEGHIEIAGARGEIPGLDGGQRFGVAPERQPVGLGFGADWCAQFDQRGSQPGEVRPVGAGGDIGVLGGKRRAVIDGGEPADEDVSDLVPVEYLNQAGQVEFHVSLVRFPAGRLTASPAANACQGVADQ